MTWKLACPSYKMLRAGKVCEDCKGGRIHNVLRHRCVKDLVALSGLVLVETMVHRALGLYRDKLDQVVVPSRFYLEKAGRVGLAAREAGLHTQFRRCAGLPDGIGTAPTISSSPAARAARLGRR